MPQRPKIKLPAKPVSHSAVPEERPPEKNPKRYIKATLYLPPAVHEELRKIAFQERRSQQELMFEGLDLMLEKHCGKTSRELLEAEQQVS